jgi:acyl-homoserine lactone acylase PvdQ
VEEGRRAGGRSSWTRQTLGYYQAYADGVNAYLKDKSPTEVSLEYAVSSVSRSGETEIEKWTPVDSVSWLKAMAWDLRSNLEDEIDRASPDLGSSTRSRSSRSLPRLPL